MSQPTFKTDATALRQNFGVSHCVANVVIIYDFIISFDREVQFLWRNKFSLAATVYFVIRYAPLLSRAIALYSLISDIEDHTSCVAVSWVYELLAFAAFTGVAVMTAMRMYAIWSGNRFLFMLTFVITMVFPIIHLVVRAMTSQVVETPLQSNILRTCRLLLADPFSSSPGSNHDSAHILLLVARAFSLFSYALVVVLLWIKTASVRHVITGKSWTRTIARLPLRDGIIYLWSLLSCNLVTFFTSALPTGLYDGDFDLILALSSVLMARFFLYLRVLALSNSSAPSPGGPASVGSMFSSVQFVAPSSSSQGSPPRTLEQLDVVEV